MRTLFIGAAIALFYVQSLTALTLDRLDTNAGALLVDVEQLQQAVAAAQEQPKPATNGAAAVTPAATSDLVMLPAHKVSIWDERGVILTADGEIGERLLRALKKHQDATCATNLGHAVNDRDLFLRTAITYADLLRDTVDGLLMTGFVQGNTAENLKAFNLTVITTLKRLTKIQNHYRKDQQ